MKSAFLKIHDHLYYKIQEGKVLALDAKTRNLKYIENLPSGKSKTVSVITENDFTDAMIKAGF